MSDERQRDRTNQAVILHEGPAARTLLEDASFIAAWAKLCRSSDGATAFQTPEFVTVWYRHYQDQYAPWLVASRGADGELSGLLPLAYDDRAGALMVAGGHQAEYQAWLARADRAASFLADAWRTIRARLPSAAMTFKYLPPGFANGAGMSSDLRGLVEVVPRRRPLMQLSIERIEESLKKKGNKSKLNRLARLGEVRLERLRSAQALGAWLDDIIVHYDMRQGATHDSCPFRADSRKRPFHLALADYPERLHVTVLSVGGRFAAAHIGAITNDTVHLGIIAHSPFYAEHSVGKLQLLLLGRHLAQEGFKTFDLTPGDDPWKERFADAHDEVYELRMFPSVLARLRASGPQRMLALAKRGARILGITSDRVRDWRERLRARANGAASTDNARECWKRSGPISSGASADLLGRDALGELLLEAEPLRKQFLASALERLESGQHVYTQVRDGKLRYCAWSKQTEDSSTLLYDIRSSGDPCEELLAANLGMLAAPIVVQIAPDAANLGGMLHRLGFERTTSGCGPAGNAGPARGAKEKSEDA